MRSIAFIPARGGSKRFQKKNIAPLNNKPLLAWTLEAALDSGLFDKIVVSSDDEAILQVAQDYGRNQVDLHHRSEVLSGDKVTTAQVLVSLLTELQQQGEHYDQCCLLLPTCPFRDAADIQASQQLLDETVDSVISMKPSPIVPDFVFRALDGQVADPFVKDSSVFKGKTRSQEYANLFYPNGAIYWAWTQSFSQQANFYSPNFKIYAMPEFRSVDIDIEEDLIYAHAIYQRFIAK